MLARLFELCAKPPSDLGALRRLEDPVRWWRALPAAAPILADCDTEIDHAVLSGALAGRTAHATIAGHQAAIRALFELLEHQTVDRHAIFAFCASEEGGAHPRAIRTTIRATGTNDSLRLDGRKQWATLAPRADRLLIVASRSFTAEHNDLCLVDLPANRAGLSIETMPATRSQPEIPHGVIGLAGVPATPAEILPGDGYRDAVKPFRTLEDLNIAAAMLGYWFGVGRRFAWPHEAIEDIVTLVAAAQALAALPVAAATTHVALAGWQRAFARIRVTHEPLWQLVDADEYERQRRDTGPEIAARARELRRERAWQELGG